ncbi:putative amidohydrolase YtcJ [Janthinobacterium sp. CG_23.4]|nr:putative amidohydrolase YtcJ [Janthinobacterium sp. CG_23.4]
MILHNGRFHTVDRTQPLASAVAIADGKFLAVGDLEDVMRHRGPATQVIDLDGRTVIPGLNDSHLHLIRGGLNYNLELRWEGVPSLADALRMLKEQALRTPNPQWVRVVGGWTEFQFAEKRMPTLDEINAAAPDMPVFILHLYDRALLNRAALRAVGYDKNTPNPPGGEIVRDAAGNPHGLADRPAQRHDFICDPGERPQVAAAIASQFHAPVHARTESPGHHQRYRRRWWLPELSRGLRRRR